MKNYGRNIVYGSRTIFSLVLSVTALLASQSSYSGPVHAYYADEHNTTPTTPTGNRILEIDIDNMELVNSLDVPGILGHHADNGFNSKIYGVPKGSGYVNVIELRKDQNGTTSMQNTKKIDLIHMPRSGDAYNKRFNVILMVARNRPMGSFINVDTDEVVGTIGENVDCRLTDGSMLLSHADANTIAGATKYQCARVANSHGGDQISGHPYWLTSDIAAVVDRANKQISTYRVWQDGNQLKSSLINHMPTRTSIHQIIPRDRTNLPVSQQADFYATEEGEHVGNMNPATGRGNTDADYALGVPHALLHMKLTTNGLQLISRIDLQRPVPLSKAKSDRILDECVANYRNTNNYRKGRSRTQAYNDLFAREGITKSQDQDAGADFPVECFFPGIPGGHNADFAPNNKHVYIGMAGGAMSIVDVDRWKIVNNLDIGIRSGPGHTCFSAKHNLALTTNHGVSYTRVIRNINTARPTISQYLPLPFTKEGLISTYQSHTCYIDENEDFYYNFFTDGGVFYKMSLSAIAANTQNGNRNMVADSLYTGGIPIQGSFINLDDIKSTTPGVQFAANNDTAESDGSTITIDVLANDTGDNLVLELVDPASEGQVTRVNGKLVYTPNAGFSGTDNFWYGISSGNSWEWALVTVTVNSTTQPVVLKANLDAVTTGINTAKTIDVLANDTGTSLTIGWYDNPDHGTASVSNGKLIYTPDAGFRGVDNFWYEVIDASGQTTWGNVVVTVGDSSFQVVFDAATVKKGQSVTIDVLANDLPGRPTLSVIDVDEPWTGTATIVGDNIVYQAADNYTGTLKLYYGVSESSLGREGWSYINITITE